MAADRIGAGSLIGVSPDVDAATWADETGRLLGLIEGERRFPVVERTDARAALVLCPPSGLLTRLSHLFRRF